MGIENPVTVKKVIKVIETLQKLEINEGEWNSGRLKGIVDWNDISVRIEKLYKDIEIIIQNK